MPYEVLAELGPGHVATRCGFTRKLTGEQDTIRRGPTEDLRGTPALVLGRSQWNRRTHEASAAPPSTSGGRSPGTRASPGRRPGWPTHTSIDSWAGHRSMRPSAACSRDTAYARAKTASAGPRARLDAGRGPRLVHPDPPLRLLGLGRGGGGCPAGARPRSDYATAHHGIRHLLIIGGCADGEARGPRGLDPFAAASQAPWLTSARRSLGPA